MPAFASTLAPKDLDRLVTFLRSRRAVKPDGGALSDSVTLDSVLGGPPPHELEHDPSSSANASRWPPRGRTSFRGPTAAFHRPRLGKHHRSHRAERVRGRIGTLPALMFETSCASPALRQSGDHGSQTDGPSFSASSALPRILVHAWRNRPAPRSAACSSRQMPFPPWWNRPANSPRLDGLPVLMCQSEPCEHGYRPSPCLPSASLFPGRPA